MTTHRVGCSLIFVTANRSGVDFEAILDRFYEELLAVEERESGIVDPDVAASLADFTADIEMGVVADSFIDAQVRAITAVRCALHTIQVATPGWEAVIAGIAAPSRRELQDA